MMDSLVVLDATGKIAWGRGEVGGDPLVMVLTQTVSDSHLAKLREDGVSYIFAGEREIDLAALESCQVLEGDVVWLRYRFSWNT